MPLNRLHRGLLFIALVMALPALSVAQAEPAKQTEQTEQTEQAEQAEQGEAAGPTLDERLDALLSEVSAYEGHESQRCLSTRTYRTVKVLNTEYLLFSRGSKHWLNKLKRDCPSLEYNDLPVFESRGSSSLCQHDPFYPSNSMDMQQGLFGGRPMAMHGTCYLGAFEMITAEQVLLLTEQN
jgi:hypothetical protein